MATGWISIHRKLVDNVLWTAEPFTRGQAWVDLLMLAKFKPGHLRIRGVKVSYQCGDVVMSELLLAKRWQWSRGKVRRFVNELETVQQIVHQKNNVTSIISITNYAEYQGVSTASETTDGHQTDTKRTPNGHQTIQKPRKNKGETTPNKVNKVNKDNKGDNGFSPTEFPDGAILEVSGITVGIPSSLKTDRFVDSWKSWIAYKAAKKQKMLPVSWQGQIKKMGELGTDTAIKAIEYSIAGGYQGICWDRFDGSRDSNGKPIKPKKELVYRDINKR